MKKHSPKSELTRRQYEKRINTAIEYIENNLSGNISLNKLAEIACFSPFHFHRVFHALTGESPADFVRRLRLEFAANCLIYNPLLAITEVAYKCGLSSPAIFSRLFKERFGKTPREWRFDKNSKKNQIKSKKKKAISDPSWYNLIRELQKTEPVGNKKFAKVKVELRNVPTMRIACVKHIKGYEDSEGIRSAYERLFHWAGTKGYIANNTKVIGMSFDNPSITPKNKCRYKACITVSQEAKPEGGVSITETHAGIYAVARFKGNVDIFRNAYDYMFNTWLPKSGYQFDDFTCFEIYSGKPETLQPKKVEFELYLPVKPL